MQQQAVPGQGANEARRSQYDEDLARALALFNVRDFDGAEALYRKILTSRPKDLIALNNAALVAKALGRPEVALVRLGKAVRYHPQSAQSQFNLANTLQQVGRLEEAISAYRRAIELKPDYVKAHLNLGNALDCLHRFEEAAACYLRALTFGGDDAETHFNLGNCFRAQNLFREALTHFICSATLEPDRAAFHNGVGMMRFEVRDYAEAITSLTRVLEIEPDHNGAASVLLYIQQIACNWSETGRLAPLVRATTDKAFATGVRCSEGPLESLSRDADPERNFKVTRDFAAQFMPPAGPANAPRRSAKTKREKIRIGYLSADFREHAVANVMAGVIESHDRERFEIFAYSSGVDDGSVWRRRIEAGSDGFVDLTVMNDREAADRIASDGIDILIDLTLWTRGSRPRIFAARPAAVQMQYLGFPGTSAAPFYDYAVVDRTVLPEDHRPYWSEALIYMPDCYFVPDASQPIAATGVHRRDCGLPEAAVVFCSFNQGYKIDPALFSAWMRILVEVPNSVLWLACGSAIAEQNLIAEAFRRNIDPARLVFAPRLDDKAQHLERYALADIALDTLAYNGHTTTSDALWAGVPVVSVLGGHFASRVSASMLQAVGLPELIAANIDDYVGLAIELAASPAQRAELRARLRAARMSAPLFDTARAVQALESGYEQAVAAHRRGAKPAHIFL